MHNIPSTIPSTIPSIMVRSTTPEAVPELGPPSSGKDQPDGLMNIAKIKQTANISTSPNSDTPLSAQSAKPVGKFSIQAALPSPDDSNKSTNNEKPESTLEEKSPFPLKKDIPTATVFPTVRRDCQSGIISDESDLSDEEIHLFNNNENIVHFIKNLTDERCHFNTFTSILDQLQEVSDPKLKQFISNIKSCMESQENTGGLHQVHDSSVNVGNETEISDIDSLSICEKNATAGNCSEKQDKQYYSNPEATPLQENKNDRDAKKLGDIDHDLIGRQLAVNHFLIGIQEFPRPARWFITKIAHFGFVSVPVHLLNLEIELVSSPVMSSITSQPLFDADLSDEEIAIINDKWSIRYCVHNLSLSDGHFYIFSKILDQLHEVPDLELKEFIATVKSHILSQGTIKAVSHFLSGIEKFPRPARWFLKQIAHFGFLNISYSQSIKLSKSEITLV